MRDLTPLQIVRQLDQYIIGQGIAKRAVAVAIRNRWRRQQLPTESAREVYPKNIILIGPTGVGKTEIARRLADLTGAPFIKVEATRYTEVGYHGRDVESMVRDLLEASLSMVRREAAEQVKAKADEKVVEQLLDLLVPPRQGQTAGHEEVEVPASSELDEGAGENEAAHESAKTNGKSAQATHQRLRQRMKKQLLQGQLEEREVEITTTSRVSAQVMFAGMGMEQMDPQLSDVFERIVPAQQSKRRVTIREARRIYMEEETEKLLDREKITQQAIERAEQSGIIFIDEIDKVATPGGRAGSAGGGGGGGGPDVSRQGVQRDLLPIVEGAAVNTRHGTVRTDHVLFIAAGAFHSSAVSDLMPELQGRFPVRVELSALTQEDFVRILKEPHNALTRQQEKLLAVEGLIITFEDAAIQTMAELAATANSTLENIGARRLMTIVEKVFEQINFDAPEMVARGEKTLTITETFVRQQVEAILKDQDLSRFVL